MSPIGRVFIVLNLLLAGGFVVFAGTNLQGQHKYKSELLEERDARKKDNETAAQTQARLEAEARQFENAKTTNENQLAAANNENARLADENKRLHGQVGSMEGDIKQLLTQQNAGITAANAAFDQAKAAYAMSQTDSQAKDEAVRAKDAAEAENRTLKTTIASLQGDIEGRDLQLAKVTKDNSELNLLVKTAEVNGFLTSMAAPNLAGTVTNAAGNLCTIAITDNVGNVDVGDMLSKKSFSFAIYDASGYKGEAIVQKFEPSENAVLCRLNLVKGDIKVGDKASTKP